MKYQTAAVLALGISIGNLIGDVIQKPKTEKRIQALEMAIHDKQIDDTDENLDKIEALYKAHPYWNEPEASK